MQKQNNSNTTNTKNAAEEYLDRRERSSHPDGYFDKAGRWYQSDDEECECCSEIRRPSRAFPLSLNQHCRSVEHLADLFNVDVKELRKEAKHLKAEQEERLTTCG